MCVVDEMGFCTGFIPARLGTRRSGRFFIFVIVVHKLCGGAFDESDGGGDADGYLSFRSTFGLHARQLVSKSSVALKRSAA